jgi:hypothetical protein
MSSKQTNKQTNKKIPNEKPLEQNNTNLQKNENISSLPLTAHCNVLNFAGIQCREMALLNLFNLQH